MLRPLLLRKTIGMCPALFPHHFVGRGACLEVVLGDAQIHLGEEAPAGGGAHAAVGQQAEREFLLIHGGGGQQSSLDGTAEPFGHGGGGARHLVESLHPMCPPVVYAMAQGDDAAQLFARQQAQGFGVLFVGEAHPARVEPQSLRLEHELFAVVAHAAVELRPLGSGHGQIVAHTRKVAVVGQTAHEGARLVGNKTYVEAALLVAGGYERREALNNFGFDGADGVAPNGMAGLDGLLQRNHKGNLFNKVYEKSRANH